MHRYQAFTDEQWISLINATSATDEYRQMINSSTNITPRLNMIKSAVLDEPSVMEELGVDCNTLIALEVDAWVRYVLFLIEGLWLSSRGGKFPLVLLDNATLDPATERAHYFQLLLMVSSRRNMELARVRQSVMTATTTDTAGEVGAKASAAAASTGKINAERDQWRKDISRLTKEEDSGIKNIARLNGIVASRKASAADRKSAQSDLKRAKSSFDAARKQRRQLQVRLAKSLRSTRARLDLLTPPIDEPLESDALASQESDALASQESDALAVDGWGAMAARLAKSKAGQSAKNAAIKQGKKAAVYGAKKIKEGAKFSNDIRALAARVDSLNDWLLIQEDEGKLVSNATTFWKSFTFTDNEQRDKLKALRSAFVQQFSEPPATLLERARNNKAVKALLAAMRRTLKASKTKETANHSSLRKAMADVVRRYANMDTAAATVVYLLVLSHENPAESLTPTEMQYDSLRTFFGVGLGETGEEILIRCASIVGERLTLLAVPMNMLLLQSAADASQHSLPMKVYTAINMHSSVEDLQRFGMTGSPHSMRVIPLLSSNCPLVSAQQSVDAFSEQVGSEFDAVRFEKLEANVVESALTELRNNGDQLMVSLKNRHFKLDLRPLDATRMSLPTGLFIDPAIRGY